MGTGKFEFWQQNFSAQQNSVYQKIEKQGKT